MRKAALNSKNMFKILTVLVQAFTRLSGIWPLKVVFNLAKK